jgi:hypothetical protein
MELSYLRQRATTFTSMTFGFKPGMGEGFIELFNKFDYGDHNPFHRSTAQVKGSMLCRDAGGPDHFYFIGE